MGILPQSLELHHDAASSFFSVQNWMILKPQVIVPSISNPPPSPSELFVMLQCLLLLCLMKRFFSQKDLQNTLTLSFSNTGQVTLTREGDFIRSSPEERDEVVYK